MIQIVWMIPEELIKRVSYARFLATLCLAGAFVKLRWLRARQPFAENSNTVYLDLFSCKWYDAEAAAEFAKEFFQADSIRAPTCLRQ